MASFIFVACLLPFHRVMTATALSDTVLTALRDDKPSQEHLRKLNRSSYLVTLQKNPSTRRNVQYFMGCCCYALKNRENHKLP